MPIAQSIADTVLLDVTLRRDDRKRHWTISAWSEGWRCRYIDQHRFSYANCPTKDGARAKRRAWESDIVAARAEGWS